MKKIIGISFIILAIVFCLNTASFAASATIDGSWTLDRLANGIEYIDGEVWYNSPTNQTINTLNLSTGTPIFQFNVPDLMHDLAWDGSSLWMDSVYTPFTIYEYDLSGTQISTFDAPSSGSMGLTYDGETFWSTSSGHPFGTLEDRKILTYDSDTSMWNEAFDSPGGTDYPMGLDWYEGYLWTTTASAGGADSTIWRLDPSTGDVVDSFTVSTYVHDLAWGGGYLWATGVDAGEYNIYKFEVSGLSVVPEPLSSVLFITGGVVLGFRRLRKRI